MASVDVIWTPDGDQDESAGCAVVLCFEAQGNLNVVWEVPKPAPTPPGQVPDPAPLLKAVASIPDGGGDLQWRGQTGSRGLNISRFEPPPVGTALIRVDVIQNHGSDPPILTTMVRPRAVSRS